MRNVRLKWATIYTCMCVYASTHGSTTWNALCYCVSYFVVIIFLFSVGGDDAFVCVFDAIHHHHSIAFMRLAYLPSKLPRSFISTDCRLCGVQTREKRTVFNTPQKIQNPDWSVYCWMALIVCVFYHPLLGLFNECEHFIWNKWKSGTHIFTIRTIYCCCYYFNSDDGACAVLWRWIFRPDRFHAANCSYPKTTTHLATIFKQTMLNTLELLPNLNFRACILVSNHFKFHAKGYDFGFPFTFVWFNFSMGAVLVRRLRHMKRAPHRTKVP